MNRNTDKPGFLLKWLATPLISLALMGIVYFYNANFCTRRNGKGGKNHVRIQGNTQRKI